MKKITIVPMLVVFLTIAPAFAEQSLFYKEVNLIGGYSDRDKGVGKSSALMNSVGFEYFRKFSNDYGDFLTADLQMRLAYDSSEAWEDAWALQIHNAWLQYKVNSSAKIKAGHFDSPFGLEQVLDTHGTILQTLASQNIGFKKDWGVALEGALPHFDYSTALQLGSGMSIYRKDGSFLATTRIGTPSENNLQGGLSLMYGEALQPKGMSTFPRAELVFDTTVLKKRVGLDGQYLWGQYLVKAEVAYGKDDKKDVVGHLFEIDYTIPRFQDLRLGLQYKIWQHDIEKSGTDDSTITLSASYKLSAAVTLRTALMHDINRMGGQEDDRVLVQLYYFGW